MESFWTHIEAHHEEYGAALFIVPVLVVVFVAISAFCAASALFVK